MPKLTGPLFSERASGSIGDVLTFSMRKTGAQVRFQRKQKDVITVARTLQRSYFSLCVSWWNMLTSIEKAEFEALSQT